MPGASVVQKPMQCFVVALHLTEGFRSPEIYSRDGVISYALEKRAVTKSLQVALQRGNLVCAKLVIGLRSAKSEDLAACCDVLLQVMLERAGEVAG